MFKYADTFCGLGGFSLAVNMIVPDAELVYACEINKSAARTFEANFKYNPLADITKLDARTLPDFDLITGGFPCQPFSSAGKHRYNQVIHNDDRANLFLNLAEILQVKQPKFFIFENVKNLLKMKNSDGSLYIDIIVNTFEAVGYKVDYKVLNSANFGIPQQRERVYFVGQRKDIAKDYIFPKEVLTCLTVSHVLESNPSDKLLLKNCRSNTFLHKDHPPFKAGDLRYKLLEHMASLTADTDTSTGKPYPIVSITNDTPSGISRQEDRVYSINSISPTVTTLVNMNFLTAQGIRKLSLLELKRLQGIPDDFILPDSEHSARKQIGNAITVNVAAAVLQSLLNLHYYKGAISES